MCYTFSRVVQSHQVSLYSWAHPFNWKSQKFFSCRISSLRNLTSERLRFTNLPYIIFNDWYEQVLMLFLISYTQNFFCTQTNFWTLKWNVVLSNIDTWGYNLRLFIIQTNLNIVKYSLLIRTNSIWNSLPSYIVALPNFYNLIKNLLTYQLPFVLGRALCPI